MFRSAQWKSRRVFLAAQLAAVLALSLSASALAQYVEVVKILAPPDIGGNDRFGQQVAISGDWLAVASTLQGFGIGSVYLYQRNQAGSNRWGPVVRVQDPTPELDEFFGRSLELEGNTLSVVSNDGISIFELTSRGTWELVVNIPQPHFGHHAQSGDVIVRGDLSNGELSVYERDAGGADQWGRVAVLLPSDGAPERFAESIAIDGDVVVAGAYADDELDRDAGSAYVWERDAEGNWQEFEVAKLFASDGAEFDEFGRSVAVEGDLIAVGAKFADAPVGNSGAVYLYRPDAAGAWKEIAKLIPDDPQVGDIVGGDSVVIEKGRVIVGARGRDAGAVKDVGAAYIFEENEAGTWHHVATVRAAEDDEEQFDFFGTAVTASGNTIAVGADGDKEVGFDKGAAYVFQLVASPTIELAGACPGEVSFTVSGATPSGAVAVAGAASEGLTEITGPVCTGVEMGLEEARLLRQFVVDSDGQAQFTRQVGPAFCGWFLQGLDAVTCGVGDTSQVPAE